jgi:hypothetical protein
LSRSALLAICAAWLGRPGAAERAGAVFEDAGRRPDEFSQEVRGQRLAGIALEVAERLGAPETVCQPLRATVRGDAARALVLESAAAELADAARERGFGAVLFKGSALDRRYGGRGLRPFGDLDLLVEPGALPAWAECLGALGYRPLRPVDRTWVRGALELVDLHAKSSDLIGVIDVPEELSPVRLDLAGMRARARGEEGLAFPALAIEDELTLAACHGLGVHAFEQLVWLLDVAALAGQIADPGGLVERASSSGADRLLYHALDAAARLGLLDAREDLLGPLRPANLGRLERRLFERLVRAGLPNGAEYLLALALPAPAGYKRTLLTRALLPRRRALAAGGTGGGVVRGALRHARRLVRLGALALWP